MAEEKNKKITPRADDFSQWYQDVIESADLAEHGPVRGTMVIKPYGYALWEMVQKTLDAKFKEHGVQNAYFPMFIPEKLLKREAQHVEGFAPEVAVVTHAGGEKLAEPLVVRPTSETIMYDVFSKWIHSYRDLPLLINQWANVVRWELRPRLFLRTTEFLWQEGHTVHASDAEADAFARAMLDVYDWFAREYMAIPGIPGMKSESEKFAGAAKTYTVEAMMQDGKALQFATSHNLGQNFAKVFGVSFLNDKNESEFGHQTSWGLSTRSIGGLIMSHSDDKGLVLPPMMAPIQVVIIPIVKEENKATVEAHAKKLQQQLLKAGVRVQMDVRDMRPGDKYYHWERKGVPIRLELGPRDIENDVVMMVCRDTGDKTSVSQKGLADVVSDMLSTIQKHLLKKAEDHRIANTVTVDSYKEFVKALDAGKFVLAHWDGTAQTEKKIKEETKATIRCVPFSQKPEAGTCVLTGEPSKQRVLFARSY